jgi:hypothetical protein
MRKLALMATVAALAVTPALAQSNMQKDSQTAPQAQPSTQAPSGMNKSMDSTKPMDATKSTSTQTMPAEKFVDMQTSGQWLASDLMGLNVVGSNNESIGEVSDFLVDDQGIILAAVVGVGGFLGIGQKDVAISFETLSISRDKDGDPVARLTLTKEELESAPAFKKADATRSAERPMTPSTTPATKPVAPRN